MRRSWLLAVLLASILAAGCQSPVRVTPPDRGAWLVFLCRANDSTVEQHTEAYYQELFDRNQRDLLFDYFQEVSNHTVDIGGSRVFGWFQMVPTTATLDPNVRNNNKGPGRGQTAQDCKQAGVLGLIARGMQVDPEEWAGFIAVVNVPVDAGAAGKSVVANQYESASFFAHEMLHVYGPLDGWTMARDLSANHDWNSGTDVGYNDCWDMMSFLSCIHGFDTPTHGVMGPELNIAARDQLGWVPGNRIFVQAGGVSPNQVTLAPVSEPDASGFLMAKVVIQGIGTYTVEYHVRTGFDRGLPRSVVVIREWRDGTTHLVTRQNGRTDWQAHETFTDNANFLSVTVDSMTDHAATITINPAYASPNPVNLGDVCGNKYVGEVLTCPAPSQCKPKVNPPLQTIDYFCQ